jgi:hypothetical protein
LREFVTAQWIHGFGIKLLALRHADVAGFFSSVDSNAWEFAVSFIDVFGMKEWTHWQRREWAFNRYRPKVAALASGPRQGVLL